MCGIAGILRWHPPVTREGEVQRMTRALTHRGPDGEGWHEQAGVAIGHRRLSIIDLAGGQQPMANEDATVWVTFNGEIYNYRDLREQLESCGHRFATRCDTEVLVHAYEQWGDGFVDRLRGMFALAIVDHPRRRVLLARDPLGIKPLVYRCAQGYFGFASELAALRQIDDAPPRGSLASIELFFRYGYIPAPDTIYQDVHKLLPGHTLVVEFDGTMRPPRRYWQMSFATEDRELDDAAWEQRFEQVVHDSVEAHLVADVPFGVFLSGGIDSTLVAMHMSRLLKQRVQAFSIGFDEQRYSELRYARQAAETLGIDLHVEIVRQDAAAVLPDLTRHYGEPFADSSALPTWYVCRMARQHVPMVLSGDGGDELFAGYPRYDLFANRSLGRVLGEVLGRREMWAPAGRLLMGRAWRADGPSLKAWLSLTNYVPAGTRRALWQPASHQVLQTRHDRFAAVAAEADRLTTDAVAWAQYVDLHTYLPDDILTKVDIASMCHGLEVRPPLIDRQVAAFAGTLPLSQRIGRDPGRGYLLKSLPKRALQRVFDASFIHRPKQGFSIPRNEWLQRGRPLRRLLEEVLIDSRTPLHQWLRPKAVRRMCRLHDLTRIWSTPLWPLLMLALWIEQNPDISFGA